MVLAFSNMNGALTLQSLSSSHGERLFSINPWPSSLLLPRHTLGSCTLVSARRRNQNSAVSSTGSSKKRKKNVVSKENDVDEDAFEALFNMLEEDLKNDELSLGDGGDADDEISEEDIDKLQRQLEAALGIGGDDDDEGGEEELLEDGVVINKSAGDAAANDGEEEGHELEVEEEEEETPLKLRNWQLRRLASALKKGRRKTSIKSLAAELCLDRAIVLEYLRNPPPSLVMLSAALLNEPEPPLVVQETKFKIESVPVEGNTLDAVKSDIKVKGPIHVMRDEWFAKKRLKKVQVETLERVYRRTKRPTNTMISSIVQVTNLPRKRVVKWFEDKRTEEGVPEQRTPYQRIAVFPYENMATLQRSKVFRRQGSSAAVWDDDMVNYREIRPCQSARDMASIDSWGSQCRRTCHLLSQFVNSGLQPPFF